MFHLIDCLCRMCSLYSLCPSLPTFFWLFQILKFLWKARCQSSYAQDCIISFLYYSLNIVDLIFDRLVSFIISSTLRKLQSTKPIQHNFPSQESAENIISSSFSCIKNQQKILFLPRSIVLKTKQKQRAFQSPLSNTVVAI